MSLNVSGVFSAIKDKQKSICLQPVAMVVPTQQCIYAPSRLTGTKVISYSEFLEKYAIRAKVIQVSFEPDGQSDPQSVTAYGFGLDCWYIVI